MGISSLARHFEYIVLSERVLRFGIQTGNQEPIFKLTKMDSDQVGTIHRIFLSNRSKNSSEVEINIHT